MEAVLNGSPAQELAAMPMIAPALAPFAWAILVPFQFIVASIWRQSSDTRKWFVSAAFQAMFGLPVFFIFTGFIVTIHLAVPLPAVALVSFGVVTILAVLSATSFVGADNGRARSVSEQLGVIPGTHRDLTALAGSRSMHRFFQRFGSGNLVWAIGILCVAVLVLSLVLAVTSHPLFILGLVLLLPVMALALQLAFLLHSNVRTLYFLLVAALAGGLYLNLSNLSRVAGLFSLHSESLSDPRVLLYLAVSSLSALVSFVLIGYFLGQAFQLSSTETAKLAVISGDKPRKGSFSNSLLRGIGAPAFADVLPQRRREIGWKYAASAALAVPIFVFFMSLGGLISVPLNLVAGTLLVDPTLEFASLPIMVVALILTPVFVAILYVAASSMMDSSRQKEHRVRAEATEEYQAIDSEDPRRPILYLRPFNLDGMDMTQQQQSKLARLMRLDSLYSSLDDAVLSEAHSYGPVLAIGKPGEPMPPLGAARRYVSDDIWQEVVKDLARSASFVILTVDDTDGVKWEIDMIFQQTMADKVLFLTSPELGKDKTNAIFSSLVERLSCDIELPEDQDIVGLRYENGGCELMVADELSFETYCIAIALAMKAQFSQEDAILNADIEELPDAA